MWSTSGRPIPSDAVAFPDELLTDGERLLVHQRPHAKLLVLPAMLFVLVCGVGGYLAALLHRASWWGFGAAVLTVVGGGLVLWFSAAPLARWFTTHFVITDRRVLVREGVFSRVGFEIPISRIDSVHLRQGLLDRIFGCGTLSIESASEADGGAVHFGDIPNVEQVHHTLREAAGGWA